MHFTIYLQVYGKENKVNFTGFYSVSLSIFLPLSLYLPISILEYKKLFVCVSVLPVSPIVTNIKGWD